MYGLSDYQYDLPDKLIAQKQAEPLESAGLLVPDTAGTFSDRKIADIPDILGSDHAVFFNDTRVVQARIPLKDVRVVTKQGREVILEDAEIFFLEKHDEYMFEALISLLKRNRPGTVIYITDGITATITKLTDKGVLLRLDGITVDELLSTYGHMPLPPYIEPTADAQERYQTVFAKHAGSVAAPTASLHFTDDMLMKLAQKGASIGYVTLHVGLGTFKPVDTEDIREYHIHEETIILPIQLFSSIAGMHRKGKKIVSVGTTVARVLETLPYVWRLAPQDLPMDVEYRDGICQDITLEQAKSYVQEIVQIDEEYMQIKTRIFIYPGFERKIVDMLLTNFHLPGSTLLMLVASFIGYEQMKEIYAYAIQEQYRFYSFGDAMLLQRL